MTKPITVITGDVHARWEGLNTLIETKTPDIVLCCGDFGYWPGIEGYELSIQNNGVKVHWCDGNHENHHTLAKLHTPMLRQVASNVFYQQRGSTVTLPDPDERKVLFMGGADSIDKDYRTPGYDWFPEEVITMEDFDRCPDTKVDIVISHTCPKAFLPGIKLPLGYYGIDKDKNPSMTILDMVLEKYQPSLWYFGHWHMFQQGAYKDTQWTMLDMYGGRGKWFVELPDA